MGFPRAMSRLLAPPLVAAMLAAPLNGCATSGVNPRSISEPNTNGRLPMHSVIRLGVGSRDIAIPFDQVAEADDLRSHEMATAVLVGLLVAGVLAIAAFAAYFSSGDYGGFR